MRLAHRVITYVGLWITYEHHLEAAVNLCLYSKADGDGLF